MFIIKKPHLKEIHDNIGTEEEIAALPLPGASIAANITAVKNGEAEIKVCLGTFAATSGTDSTIEYPAGYTMDNCVLLAIMAYNESINCWMPQVYASGTTATITYEVKQKPEGIVVNPRNNGYLGRPVMVVLMKIKEG